MAKRNNKKTEKSSFYEEKSLVGLTPENALEQFYGPEVFSSRRKVIRSKILRSTDIWDFGIKVE